MEIRKYQQNIAEAALDVFKWYPAVILNCECRTGKTITAFEISSKIGAKKILFITKME